MRKEQRERLEKVLPLCRHLAWKFAVSGEEYEDLRGVALERAAKEAIEFKPEPGRIWEAYTYQRITWAIQDHMRANDWMTRNERRRVKQAMKEDPYFEPPKDPRISLDAPVSHEGAITLHEVIAGEVPEAFSSMQELERRQVLDAGVESLPLVERQVLTAIFRMGMGGEQTAKMFGLSASRVSQIKNGALLRLRQWFKEGKA